MRFIKTGIFLLVFLTGNFQLFAQKELTFLIDTSKPEVSSKLFHDPGNSFIQYTGRIEKTTKSLPWFWSPGVYIKANFKGNICKIYLNDEVLYGTTHNYIDIIIDDNKPERLQTKVTTNTITIKGLSDDFHTITICKDTEAGNGYLEFAGIYCQSLLQPPPKPKLKIEFIGNSITCGYGADESEIACGKGQWYDQHNAYMSYGPLTARALNAQWQLSAVSGIGLIHSCCNMTVTMPHVFDKINMREDSIAWDFKQYVPDMVTICLGQNDGIQDSTTFCKAYIDFVKTVRSKYEKANIILVTSPMGDEKLTSVLKNYLTSIVSFLNKNGDKNIQKYFFKKRYHNGCGSHPSLSEHQVISKELVGFIKSNGVR